MPIQAITSFLYVQTLWNPLALLFFQVLWLLLFLATGVSKVTGSTISFHVRKETI